MYFNFQNHSSTKNKNRKLYFLYLDIFKFSKNYQGNCTKEKTEIDEQKNKAKKKKWIENKSTVNFESEK